MSEDRPRPTPATPEAEGEKSEEKLGQPPSGGGESRGKTPEEPLPEKRLPTEEIPTKKITWERGRMLANTRRSRMSGFALGGFVAALPGAAQSIADYLADKKMVPSLGHWIEILFAVMFGTATLISLIHFGEPTSRDVLAKTFPEMVEEDRFIRRLRRWCKKVKDDFKVPV